MRQPEDTTTIERDLGAIDTALAVGIAAHEDSIARGLQELALALRAEAEQPDAGFATTLSERVDAGFPSRKAPRPRAAAPSWLPAALATAAIVAVVAVVIAIGGGSSGVDDAGSGGGSAVTSAGSGRSTTPAPGRAPSGAGFAPDRRARKIERSVSMTLEAPDDEVADVAEGVTRVTDRNGGFVLRSELDTGDDGASGSYELRIPSPRLRAALRDLAELATVRSQSQSGQDVTRAHVTARDRLEAARAERSGLLRRLQNASTDEEAEAIRRRLALVAGQIDGLRARLRDLRLRTDYAVVDVELDGTGGSSGAAGGAGGSLDDALGDAGTLLVGTAGVLIRVLAVAIPLGAIGLAGWAAARAIRRRRRESVLV